MRMSRILLPGAAIFAATACVPRAESPRQPPPQSPQPQPLPPPPPAARDWRDLELTPGRWVYSASGGSTQALFGAAGGEASFIVRCDRASRQIILSREGAPAAPAMIVRTSYTARTLPAAIQRDPIGYASASLSASDPILDSMAFSRGRFTVEAAGLPMLVIPAWPEPARVIEDCRG